MHAHGYKFYIHTYILTCSLRSLVKYRVEHEKKNRILKRVSNILFIVKTLMARCCGAVFLLAETEVPVAMTTVISSHVKDKNCIFTGYQIIFVTGKILVFH